MLFQLLETKSCRILGKKCLYFFLLGKTGYTNIIMETEVEVREP
jgi:hypothetical protein